MKENFTGEQPIRMWLNQNHVKHNSPMMSVGPKYFNLWQQVLNTYLCIKYKILYNACCAELLYILVNYWCYFLQLSTDSSRLHL